ncbi:MAG: hypothetical protein E7164_03435 [Firmicutes bacterium]|nr:hypothetical protein [Bacillota bacterium]
MEKYIDIEIRNESDLYDKYNNLKASPELISYIIESSITFYSASKITLVVNNYLKKDIECKKLIDEGLRNEYKKSLRRHQRNNIAQVFYFVVGIFTLFLSTLVKSEIFKELIVIGGWVFIWELVEVELFSEMKGLKRRRLIKKILKSPIIERKL